MASTALRFAGRALRRSIPRALEEEQRFFPRSQALSLVQSPRLRLFSSDSVKPSEHSSSDLVARLDNSGHRKHILQGGMSRDEYMRMELHNLLESMLRSGQKLAQIEVALAEKSKRDAMYARRRAAFVGASVIVSGIAGLAFCAKKVLFG